MLLMMCFLADRGNDNWLIKYDKPDIEPQTDQTDNAEVSLSSFVSLMQILPHSFLGYVLI
jgi:hypothetical protein